MGILAIIILLNNFGSWVGAAEWSGSYQLSRANCSDGKALKLGGPVMEVGIKLIIREDSETGMLQMDQTATSKSVSYVPFKLSCTMINRGQLRFQEPGRYYGSLVQEVCNCSNLTWQQKLCPRQDGAEAEGVMEYWWEGAELAIKFPTTKNTYSCKNGSVPVYYYR